MYYNVLLQILIFNDNKYLCIKKKILKLIILLKVFLILNYINYVYYCLINNRGILQVF